MGRSVDEFREEFGCCVATIGNFDGVHLGHREMLSRLKRKSEQLNCPALLITFDPHPSSVLYPGRAPALLSTLKKKLSLLEECGLDGALVVEFTLQFAQHGPRDFVEDVLLPLKVRELYVGHDFHFGSGRSGNVNSLAHEGKVHDFGVYEISEVIVDGERVRSSLIRRLISEGDVEKAARLLARQHSVSGIVKKGAGRGKTLGFPTGNLGELVEAVPGAGIYATRTKWKGKLYDSATHVGVIPTFDVDVPGIETHLFDFNEDLLGKELEISFYKKLRETQRYDSVDDLKEQIRMDCENAKKVLSNIP
ncbi:MAG: bifunctional riboflavin kinase/FAD synthetase [Nitrospinota bacterium]